MFHRFYVRFIHTGTTSKRQTSSCSLQRSYFCFKYVQKRNISRSGINPITHGSNNLLKNTQSQLRAPLRKRDLWYLQMHLDMATKHTDLTL
jgi:hypothetical protein